MQYCLTLASPGLCILFPQDREGCDMCNIDDWQQLEAWLQAASAGLQLLPLLAAWHGAWHAQGATQAVQPLAAAGLATGLLSSLWACGPWKAYKFLPSPGSRPRADVASLPAAQAAASLAAQAFRLHQLGCTAAHFVAYNQVAMTDVLGGQDFWRPFLSGLGLQLCALEQLLELCGPEHADMRWVECDVAVVPAAPQCVTGSSTSIHTVPIAARRPCFSALWLEAASAAQWEAASMALGLGAELQPDNMLQLKSYAGAAAHHAPLVRQPALLQLLKSGFSSKARV